MAVGIGLVKLTGLLQTFPRRKQLVHEFGFCSTESHPSLDFRHASQLVL